METKEKVSFVVEISGGVFPKTYRKTTIRVSSNDPYEVAKRWANVNFPDWNGIHILYDVETAEIENPVIPSARFNKLKS